MVHPPGSEPQQSCSSRRWDYRPPAWPPVPGFLAATTLLAAGLLVSTFLVDLLLVAGAVFLPPRDFFSMAIVVSPFFLFNCFTQYLSASEWPNRPPPFHQPFTPENKGNGR